MHFFLNEYDFCLHFLAANFATTPHSCSKIKNFHSNMCKISSSLIDLNWRASSSGPNLSSWNWLLGHGMLWLFAYAQQLRARIIPGVPGMGGGKAPFQLPPLAEFWPHFRVAGDMESKLAIFHAVIADVAVQNCGRSVTSAGHGSNLQTCRWTLEVKTTVKL